MQLALDTTFCVFGSKSWWLTPYHERAVGAVAGSRHDDQRCARLEVGGGLVPRREEAGRLDDDVDAELTPREVGRVALAEHPQLVVADLDAVLRGADLVRQGAEHGVVLEEVGHRVQRAEVVDGDEVEVGAPLLRRPEEVAADAAEAVDADAYGHAGDHSQPGSAPPQLLKRFQGPRAAPNDRENPGTAPRSRLFRRFRSAGDP